MPEVPEQFYVFADDHQAYGPADTKLLQEWVSQGHLSPQSWIYHAGSDSWMRAEGVQALKGLLPSGRNVSGAHQALGPTGLKAGQMRRIRLFAEMTDDQIDLFLELVEKVKVRAFSAIVKRGEHAESMYLILEGEARVSMQNDGKEELIATLTIGDFFGEVALLDAGPRSADVIANKDCTLLKLTRDGFKSIMETHSDIAACFLMSMNRFLSDRIRAGNERFTQAKNFARRATGEVTAPISQMKWKRDVE